MKKSILFLILIIIGILVISVGIVLFGEHKPTPSGPYKFDVKIQNCFYIYGVNGNGFFVETSVTNMGTTVSPPLTIWLLHDNKICDKIVLDKSYSANEILFKDNPYDNAFGLGCEVTFLPPNPEDAEKINKPFQIVYTTDSQDPLKDGFAIFSSNTKKICGVAVE